jgi:hypothetical protein
MLPASLCFEPYAKFQHRNYPVYQRYTDAYFSFCYALYPPPITLAVEKHENLRSTPNHLWY